MSETSLGPSSSEMDWHKVEKNVLWSDESTFQIISGNQGHCDLWAKEKKDYPDCYQHQLQKLASVMASGCVSAHVCHICEGHINGEYRLMLPSRRLFQRPPCLFQRDNAKTHAVQTCLLLTMCGALWSRDPRLLSTWSHLSSKKGKEYHFKTLNN